MPRPQPIIIPSEVSAIPSLQEQVRTTLDRHAIPAEIADDLRLIVEEVTTNIVKYSYHNEASHFIALSLRLSSKSIRLEFEDTGLPFNPITKTPNPNLDQTIENRPIGGLGLYLVKQLSDNLEYVHVDGKNKLTVVKDIV